ncbi:hypothetical protein [Streptomyces sp. GS7]|uniref:hypothetical protein n=1 Tax=Streptomyces sp. GS7 TaxID=2692234 RepID=UPI0013193CEF|nr:hypothetical protein [Streptomyces sp. GS7]QHC23965.1 hypothetical protein GR130_23930 [Streptomyces sp. GS7]
MAGAWNCGDDLSVWAADGSASDRGRGGIRFWNKYAEDARWSGQCLDTYGDGSRYYKVNGCNGGNYQRWDDFGRST